MGESGPHSRSKNRLLKSGVLTCVFGMCAFLSLNCGFAHADTGDDLVRQYQDLQKETTGDAKQISSLQDSLDKMSSRTSTASPDYQTLQNKIIELKQKDNGLYEKKSDIATQLKKFGRNPDQPNSNPGSTGKPTTSQPTKGDRVSTGKPLQKEDGGEVASADVTKLSPNLIRAKPPVALNKPPVFNAQNAAGTPTGHSTKSIASVFAPPNPAIDAEIDAKVRQQKPEVELLIKLASGEPEPPPDVVASAPVPMPVESPAPQAVSTPAVGWTAVAIGTVLAGTVAAVALGSAGSGGGSSSGGAGRSPAVMAAPSGRGRTFSPCH